KAPKRQIAAAPLVVDGEPVKVDLPSKNTIMRSGCDCDDGEITFPGDLTGKVDEPLNFHYDGSYVCHGQAFKNFDGYIVWTGTQVTPMRNENNSSTFPGIWGTVRVKFSQPGSYNVRASFKLECYDTGPANCVKSCLGEGHTVVTIR